MERIQWIRYGQTDILVGNYSGIRDSDEYSRIIEENTDLSIREIKKRYRPAEHSACMLIDVQDSVINHQTLSVFKLNAKRIEPYTKQIAVLGITGVKKIFLDSVLRFSNVQGCAFDQRQNALEWLAGEST